MNGSTRANIAIATMAAAIATPFVEKHWHIQVSADDVLDVLAAGGFAWHAFSSAVGPYAGRVFDHYFPPNPPAQSPGKEMTK